MAEPITVVPPKLTTPPKGGPSRKPKKRLPPWAWVIGLVVVLGLGWFGWSKLHPTDSGIGLTITGKVKRGDLVETVTATGSVAAQTGAEVKIGSQISGRIKHLYADVGTVVKAGQLIAELDLPDLHAQLAGSQAAHAASEEKLIQQRQNVTLGNSQTQSAIALGRASLNSAQHHYNSVVAAARLQKVQTPADIFKAQAVLGQSMAALATTRSSLIQTQAGIQLEIQTSQEALNQALATDLNNQTNLSRQQALLDKGYVAGILVDQATQAAGVSKSQVISSVQALNLTKQKMTADLQTGTNAVTQAERGVDVARAALKAAEAESYTVDARSADVADSEAAVAQSVAGLQLALGNLTANAVRMQDVAQASEAAKQSSAAIDVSQAQLDKAFIRSPIAGTVLQLASEQGETLAAGLSAPTLIIVADLKRLEVDAYVDETDIGKVRIGQPVQIAIDAYSDEKLTGKVAKVASGSTIQQGVVTYAVTVFFSAPTVGLKPDMTASVTIETGRRNSVLTVPSVAIQVGANDTRVNTLAVKDGQSAIKSVVVKTGGTDGLNTEIVSGLSEGQVIVLAGGRSTGRTSAPTSAFSSGSPGGGGGGGGRGGGGGGGRGGG